VQEFTKSDIKVGMIVKLRNGYGAFVDTDTYYKLVLRLRDGGTIYLDSYPTDLVSPIRSDYDITEVYTFGDGTPKLVWKRSILDSPEVGKLRDRILSAQVGIKTFTKRIESLKELIRTTAEELQSILEGDVSK